MHPKGPLCQGDGETDLEHNLALQEGVDVGRRQRHSSQHPTTKLDRECKY